MKVELRNPRLINDSHYRDLYIDNIFIETGTYSDLYNKFVEDNTIPDDATYIEHSLTEVPDYIGTVGYCRDKKVYHKMPIINPNIRKLVNRKI